MSKEKKTKKGLKIFGIIVLVLIIILVLATGVAYLFVKNKLSKINTVDINVNELNVSTEVEQKLSGYRNIAIFGIDSRADNYDKGNRSDCIIIASINNDTKEVKLVSVYRDTYVQIEGYGLDKITHAYSYGEAPLAIKTLNTNLDLNIKEFVTVNFEAVVDCVDAIGGIELDITSEELKYINPYVHEINKVTKQSAEDITTAGKQHVNGVQAVAYSRIRYTEGGDYKRAERMRTVITEIANKLKTKSLAEINSFTDTILPKVYTNISEDEIISLIPSMMKYNITKSIGWPYEIKGKTIDRWYGVPVTLESNVTRLHKEIFEKSEYVPTKTVKNISNKIVQKTGYSK